MTGQYAAKAWVNFNGTGAVEIRASGNVSSITDNNTGNYTVNFANAMQNVNYATIGSAQREGTTNSDIMFAVENRTVFAVYSTTQVSIVTQDSVGTYRDASIVNVAIFR